MFEYIAPVVFPVLFVGALCDLVYRRRSGRRGFLKPLLVLSLRVEFCTQYQPHTYFVVDLYTLLIVQRHACP